MLHTGIRSLSLEELSAAEIDAVAASLRLAAACSLTSLDLSSIDEFHAEDENVKGVLEAAAVNPALRTLVWRASNPHRRTIVEQPHQRCNERAVGSRKNAADSLHCRATSALADGERRALLLLLAVPHTTLREFRSSAWNHQDPVEAPSCVGALAALLLRGGSPLAPTLRVLDLSGLAIFPWHSIGVLGEARAVGEALRENTALQYLALGGLRRASLSCTILRAAAVAQRVFSS